VHIDVVSWDDPHAPAQMDARFTPQQAVDRSLPTPAECDVTVVLLWGRMGTPLTEKKADGTRYLSGTEWEFENALKADKPVLLYRKSGDVMLNPRDPEFEEKLQQLRRVDSFFARFVGEGGAVLRAHAPYASTEDLLTRLRQDVERYLAEVLDEPDANSAAERPRGVPRVGQETTRWRGLARPAAQEGRAAVAERDLRAADDHRGTDPGGGATESAASTMASWDRRGHDRPGA
jgi:hypothetical protein